VSFCFRVCFDFLFLWLDLLQAGEFAASFNDPSPQPLVPSFIDLLFESRAANTVQKYSCSWQRGNDWAHFKLGAPVLPAIPLKVALYLTELVNRAVCKGHSVYVIESASYSFCWGGASNIRW